VKDNDKTNKQLINELTDVRQRVTDLEGLVFEYKRKEKTLKQNIEKLRSILDKSILHLHQQSKRKILIVSDIRGVWPNLHVPWQRKWDFQRSRSEKFAW